LLLAWISRLDPIKPTGEVKRSLH